MLEFYVKDTGIGIDPKYHAVIFERFRQVYSDLPIFQSGSGLGLAISKSYIELMGGRIWLESERGKGSVFYFEIPYLPHVSEGRKTEIMDTKPIPQLLTQTILVAEDDETNFWLINEILRPLSLNIIRATDGERALNICLSDNSIALVLMDLKMPIMDGYEALKQIKHVRPQLPIIAQTAYALQEDKKKVMSAGFNGYISKPYNKNELFAVISEFLK